MPLVPLGALAAGFGLASASLAQTAPTPAQAEAAAQPPAAENTLPTMRATAAAEPNGKADYQATETRIGKGRQDLRDIPQSLTIVTEKVMDDRRLTQVKEVLRNTSGISFQAAEGGEEDIKLNGISLQSTGDIFIDGMRDPAFYERDTFFLDRLELLRGSAALMFGRGSTGGAVNQVTKQARLADENQIDLTVSSHGGLRAVGDFNRRTGETSALHLSAMQNIADSDGAGTRIDKRGVAGNLRWGIGEADEFSATAFALQNDNGINYGVRWIRPTAGSTTAANALNHRLDPDAYYGLASDFNLGSAYFGMLQHTHRFSRDAELVTKARYADYTRDQRATLWNFAGAAAQPDGLGVTLDTLSPNTVLTRGTQLKKQAMQTLTVQSDLSARFSALGYRQQLFAGIDLAHEKKQVFAAISAAQGGVVPSKPETTIGHPYDGARIDESLRSYRPNNDYVSRAWGGYIQNMVELSPAWKLLAGLRFDHLQGDYNQYAAASSTAVNPLSVTPYQMTVSEWSKRAAVLFQPTAQWSFHLMGATSFNASGDTYSLSAANVDIAPEQSVNVELGAKFDTADGRLSTRVSVFRNTKLHERNTDPLVNLVTLSGKRHAAGLNVDLVGRINPKWEVFGTFTWMPVARIDESSLTGATGVGTRPELTPRYSGTLWTAYKVQPQWRVGAGLNARSSQQPNRNPGFFAPRFVVVDAMAEYTVKPDTLSFQLNLKNLTNKLYADQLYTSFYVPGPGRVVSLTGSYRF